MYQPLRLIAVFNLLSQLLAGTIYFYFPQLKFPHTCTGGVAALQELHQTLLQLNFETKFHSMASCYTEFIGINLSHFNISVRSQDIVIVPESLSKNEYNTFLETRRDQNLSTRIFVFSLAAVLTRLPEYNTPYPKLLRMISPGGSIPIIANSYYIRGYHSLYSSPRSVSPSSLQRVFSNTSEQDSVSYSKVKDRKIPVIMVDSDFLRGSHPLEHIMTEDTYASSVLKAHYDVICIFTLGGLNSSDLIDVYKSGSIIIDGYVPGFERIVQEASLYGAIPILNAKLNSLNSHDFNIPRELVVDFMNTTALDAAILNVLLNYDAYFRHLAPFREKIRMLPSLHRLAVDSVFSSHFASVFVDISNLSDQEWRVFPFIFSTLHYNSLASIAVVVNRLPEFLSAHGMLIEALMDQGLTTIEGGDTFSSVRFYDFSPTKENICGLIDISGGRSVHKGVAESFSKLYKPAMLHSSNRIQRHGEVIILADILTQINELPIKHFRNILDRYSNESTSVVGYYTVTQLNSEEKLVFMFQPSHFECITAINRDINDPDLLESRYCSECFHIQYIQIVDNQLHQCENQYQCSLQDQEIRYIVVYNTFYFFRLANIY